jgi:hypothetical protein
VTLEHFDYASAGFGLLDFHATVNLSPVITRYQYKTYKTG